ncbi:hypothetical protein LJR189_001074 [Acidovorax delafieldii]|uniref:hypothetical protein n=1 Tax=Acidovorax delafieldii TaxID=47920 RepID=UPI003ED0BF00
MADRTPSGASASGAAARAHSSPSCSCSSSFPPPLSERAPHSLALDANDNAGDLRTTLQAYGAIEKLMSCHGAKDSQTIVAHRDELGALLRLVNERFAQDLDALDSTLQTLHSALGARETLQ